jgi:hypothetical protein
MRGRVLPSILPCVVVVGVDGRKYYYNVLFDKLNNEVMLSPTIGVL